MAKKAAKASPKTADQESYKDVLDGELKKRIYGLRVDDDVEINIIAGNELLTIKGRLLSMKDDLEIVTEDQCYQKIIMDWVVGIKVVKHNRPPPDKDKEIGKKISKPPSKKSSVDHAYN